jgi:hypothetical protein
MWLLAAKDQPCGEDCGLLTVGASWLLTAGASGLLTACGSGLLTACASGLLTACASELLTVGASGLLTAGASGLLTAGASGLLTTSILPNFLWQGDKVMVAGSMVGEGMECQGKHVHLVERMQEEGLGHLAPIIQDFSTENQLITRNLSYRFQVICLPLLGDAVKTLALASARIVKVTVYLVVAKMTEWDIPVNKVLLGLREGKLWQQS